MFRESIHDMMEINQPPVGVGPGGGEPVPVSPPPETVGPGGGEPVPVSPVPPWFSSFSSAMTFLV